jgi:hypothetical protein
MSEHFDAITSVAMLLPYAKYSATSVPSLSFAVDSSYCRGVERSSADEDVAVIGARIRYDHTMRALQRQSTVLSELRSRASIILSAMGITASLFGARALRLDAPGWLKAIALVLLALGLVACMLVLSPVRDRGTMPDDPRNPGRRFGRGAARRWKVTPRADEVKKATSGDSERAMLDAIVALMTPARRLNYRTLEERSLAFNWAVLLLVLQVVAWSVVLLAS